MESLGEVENESIPEVEEYTSMKILDLEQAYVSQKDAIPEVIQDIEEATKENKDLVQKQGHVFVWIGLLVLLGLRWVC